MVDRPAVVERVFTGRATPPRIGQRFTTPLEFVTTGEDNLRVVSANSVSGVTLRLQGRRLNDQGDIVTFSERHVPTSDRVTKRQDYPLGAGALMNLTIYVEGGTPSIGQTYVIVQLIRGFSGATVVLGTLLAGYITPVQALGWPGSPIVSSVEGDPVPRVIAGTTPAAADEWSETVPTGARWEVIAINAELVTGATVGNRSPFVRILGNGSNITLLLPSYATQVASRDYSYYWAAGFPVGASGNNNYSVLPSGPLILPATARLDSVTSGIVPGDQWAYPVLSVREWLEVNV